MIYLKQSGFQRHLNFATTSLPGRFFWPALSLFLLFSAWSEVKRVGPALAQSKPAVDAKKGDDKKYQGYIIRQTALNQGSVTTYLCPTCWVLKTAIITVAGDQEKDSVFCYTRATNKYLSDTLQKGMRRFNGFRRGGDFSWGPSKVIGHTKWQDEDAVVIERKGRRTDLHTVNDVIITEKLLFVPRLKVSKAYEMVAFSLLDADCSYGMLVRVERMARSKNPHYCTRRPVIVQDTLSIKPMTFKPSDFQVPKGLTRVKTEIDLFSTDEGMPFNGASDAMRRRERKLNIQAD